MICSINLSNHNVHYKDIQEIGKALQAVSLRAALMSKEEE